MNIALVRGLRPFAYAASFLIYCLSLDNPLVAATVHRGNETDRLSLLAFKGKISDDPLGVLGLWNDSTHFCKWHGVTCRKNHQRVIVINLSSQKLTGYISPYIGNLSFLKGLYLDNNSFIQTIPQELGYLHRLQYLWLNNNSISGELPANISACSNLLEFDVSYNKLEGSIPVELGLLSKIQLIYIDDNNLTGSVPASIGNLTSLVEFYAGFNGLDGIIPDLLGRLRKLEAIALSDNKLSGIIPPKIFNLSTITGFEVSGNQLEGSLPPDMGITLPNLDFLSIADNQFMGLLPPSLSNMSNLEYLMVDGNKFTGKMPNLDKLHKLLWLSATSNRLGYGGANDVAFLSSLINATSLESLAINNNSFGGMLPESFWNLSSKLSLIYIDNNHISGTIPDGIGNFINLEDIQLWNNKFTGNIPPIIGRLKKLKALDLSLNRFTGEIPSSLGNLTMLNQLSLRGNNLHGSVPSSLGNCQHLLELDLSINNLTSIIRPEFFSLSSLSILLNLSRNHLIGFLPTEVGNLKNLGQLDLSFNMLSGEIPNSLAGCVSLEILHMEGNYFQGKIPSLSSLGGLQFLDLSSNNLSGNIPEFLGDLKLRYLNLSLNDFDGMVPAKGIFMNASAFSVSGNPKLCGGISGTRLPKCNSKPSRKAGLSFTFKLIIAIVSAFMGACMVVGLLFFCWLKKGKQELASGSLRNSMLNVSFHSLYRATNGFSSTNLIGMGNFGTVYRGNLHQYGTVVAVKVLNLSHHGASKSFIAECEAFKNIKHLNLVKILTACSSIDNKGNDFKALVYELMANGSLEDWLHPSPKDNVTHSESKGLKKLLQRLNILVDVAHALDYLHNHCQNPIVHCDLKPSNVLLDSEFVGHVSDFGIARILSTASLASSSSQASSSVVKGTVGYAAPEYAMGSSASTYGDMYSFGVLLLEMFTGKRPTDDIFKDGLNIHKYVEDALPDQVEEIVDPILIKEMEQYRTEETTEMQCFMNTARFQECVVSLLKIGVICSSESTKQRMNSSDVVAKVESVKKAFLEVGR